MNYIESEFNEFIRLLRNLRIHELHLLCNGLPDILRYPIITFQIECMFRLSEYI